MSDYKGVFVICEQRDSKLQNVSLELIGKAKELADKLNQTVTALVVGSKVEDLIPTLAKYGADKVVYVQDDRLEKYMTEPYTKAVAEVIKSHKPEIALFGATSIGRDLAPRVSARVRCGLTADCTSLDIEEETNLLLMTRPAFGGNLMATIISKDTRPQMSTVRPGVMRKLDPQEGRECEVEKFDVNFTNEDFNVEIVEEHVSDKKKINIEEASILVSVGRGIGHQDKLDSVRELAQLVKGVMSASRAVVDAGWVDKDLQVGQTGKTVRPNLYFALGISGAIQHLAGMEESDLIIAVNKNPDAPIFQVADLGIVGDVHKVIPELKKLLEKEMNK